MISIWHYGTNIIYRDTIPSTSIELFIHKMNFDMQKVLASYPQYEVHIISHDIEWMSLDYAFNYGVKIAFGVSPVLSMKS